MLYVHVKVEFSVMSQRMTIEMQQLLKAFFLHQCNLISYSHQLLCAL